MPSLPHAGFSVRPSLGSYLESFRVYYMPDTVLVNTTNTTWEEVWAFPQGGHCLGRRENAQHKISAMGEEEAFLMVQKWREGWSWLCKNQQILQTSRRGTKFDYSQLSVCLVSEVETNRLEPRRVLLTSASEIPKPSPFPNSLSQPTFTQLLD